MFKFFDRSRDNIMSMGWTWLSCRALQFRCADERDELLDERHDDIAAVECGDVVQAAH